MSSRLKILLVVLGAVIVASAAWLYYYGPLGEAAGVEVEPDRISIFVYPNRVVANGKETSKIIAVVKKDQKPMSGVKVNFKTSLGVLSDQEGVTDFQGQAVSYVLSGSAGEAKVTVSSGGLSKEETVTFFNQR